MCIRDSVGPLGARLPVQRADTAAGAGGAAARRLRRAGDTCLLYTSDAADERSSVDLGGRRIIKQKQHYEL